MILISLQPCEGPIYQPSFIFRKSVTTFVQTKKQMSHVFVQELMARLILDFPFLIRGEDKRKNPDVWGDERKDSESSSGSKSSHFFVLLKVKICRESHQMWTRTTGKKQTGKNILKKNYFLLKKSFKHEPVAALISKVTVDWIQVRAPDRRWDAGAAQLLSLPTAPPEGRTTGGKRGGTL